MRSQLKRPKEESGRIDERVALHQDVADGVAARLHRTPDLFLAVNGR